MGKKVILNRKSRADRKAARAEIGPLKDQVIAESTLKRYEAAVALFYGSLDEQGLQLPADVEGMDVLAAQQIERLWQEGDQRTYAGDLLSGLSHFLPHVRGKLPASWRLFTAWGKTEMPSRAPPLSVDIILAVIGLALQDGEVEAAAVMSMGFHGVLRTQEMAETRTGAIFFNTSKGTAVVNLGLTKGGQRKGVVEHVVLDDANVVRLLAAATQQKQPGDLVCSLGSRKLQVLFRGYISQVGLGHVGYKLYSLRRGGATHWFRVTNSMEATCERGRWQSSRTARIYVNDGLLELLDLNLNPKQQRAVARGLKLWELFNSAQPLTYSRAISRPASGHLGKREDKHMLVESSDCRAGSTLRTT